MSMIFFLTFRLRAAVHNFGVSANSRGQSAGGAHSWNQPGLPRGAEIPPPAAL